VIDIDTLLPRSYLRHLTEQCWDRTPLHIPGERDKFKDLGFDREVFFRLCLDNPQIKAAYNDERAGVRQVLITGNQARSLYDSGMTICASFVDKVHSQIGAYTREIKRALSLPGPIWANCYLSPAGKGFGLHFDDRSAFVLQIEGSKRWFYSATPAMIGPPQHGIPHELDQFHAAHPWAKIEVPGESELQQQLLSPGDIFYMPAGTWHRAEAGEYSLALTIGCRSATFTDLLYALLARQFDADADWRRILPALADARDDGRVRAVFSDRIAQLKSWVASLDSDTLMAEWEKSIVADAQPSSNDENRAIERGDRLAVPHQLSCSTEGEQLIIRCQGSSFGVPLHLRPFIERLSARKTFVADEALGWCEADEELDWSDVSEALQTLREQGIIRRQSDSSGLSGD
jgi:hypothetical protein